MLVSKARRISLWSGTKFSDKQWEAIARQATSNHWRVKSMEVYCDIPNYDAVAIIITRTEKVWISEPSPYLVPALANAINTCEKDKLRCREIMLHRDMETKWSVGRDLSRKTGWTLTQDSAGHIKLQITG